VIAAITALTFLTVLTLVYSLLAWRAPAAKGLDLRLKALEMYSSSSPSTSFSGRSGGQGDELAKPLRERLLAPLKSELATSLARFTPGALRRAAEEKLAAAGGMPGLGTEGFLLLSVGGATGFSALAGAGGWAAGLPLPKAIVLAGSIFFAAIIASLAMLDMKAAQRRKSILRDLPDALDLLTVSVEAGLSFDGALAKLTEKSRGPLADEFSRLLNEVRVGMPRREALAAMARRCGVPELSTFTAAVIQADQLGVSIGNVLRVQAATVREKRRQRVQEAAMKAPIKMLFPLVFFIFPTIFIVLLGPAVIQLMGTVFRR